MRTWIALISLIASTASADTRWTGSEVSLSAFASVLSLDRNAELSYDPIFTTTLAVDPVYRVNDRLTLIGHAAVDTELTNADDTSRLRQPLLEDTSVEADWAIRHLALGLGAAVGLRLTLPTSKASLAQERLFTASPFASLRRSFRVGRITLTPYVSAKISFNEQLSRATTYENPTIGACAANGGDCEAFDHSGVRATMMSFTGTVGVNADFGHHLTALAVVQDVNGFLYPLDGTVGTTGGNDTRWRHTMVYELEAAWQPRRHFAVAGGLWTENPQLAPDSTYYAPFFNRYTTVFAKTAYSF